MAPTPLWRHPMQKPSTHFERLARWIAPIALIALALGAIYVSTTFKRMPPILKRGIQPSDFPQLISGLIIFLTLLMAWFDPVKLTERVSRQTLYTLAAMALFVALVQVDLFIALGVFALTLSLLWGERRPAILGLVALVVPFAIFVIFDQAFQIRFPRGVLTNLWYG